jgi:CHC2 zinc finger
MNIPRLHPDTIEEVKAKVDIVDVIGGHVVLKKRGKDYLGSCPFHQEKSPSFSVSPTKQMYYCFGCQAGGNAINFMMELGKQSFTEVGAAISGSGADIGARTTSGIAAAIVAAGAVVRNYGNHCQLLSARTQSVSGRESPKLPKRRTGF